MSKSFRSNSEENYVQHRPRSRKVKDEFDESFAPNENFALDSAGVSDDDARFIHSTPKYTNDSRKK